MFNNKTYTTFRESDLPPLIYKYRKWSDPLHKTILTRNEIYFPKPFDVEEKFELSLPTDYVSISEEDIIDYYYQELLIRFPNLNHKRRLEYARNNAQKAPFRNNDQRELIEQSFRKSLNNSVGIFCASETENNQHLWSSFAGGDGFCVGFHTKLMLPEDDNITGGTKVCYFPKANPPKMKIFYKEGDSAEDHIKFLHYLPKELYGGEEEFRLVRYISQKSDQKVIVPVEAYAKIIISTSMKTKFVKEIQEIHKDRHSNIELINH